MSYTDLESYVDDTEFALSGFKDERQRVFILCANESNESLIPDRIISPLTKDGIPCFYDRSQFPLGYTKDRIYRKYIQRHSVTILPITKKFNEEFSDAFIEKIFPVDYHLNHLVICIILETGCRVPTVFEQLTMLDFSKGQSEEDNIKVEKRMTRAIKYKIEKRKRKKKLPSEGDVGDVNIKDDLDVTTNIEVPVEYVAIDYFDSGMKEGLLARNDKIKESEKRFSRHNLPRKYALGITAFCKFYVGLQDLKSKADVEDYVLYKVLPRASVEKLAELVCLSTSRVQIAVLEAIRERIDLCIMPIIFSCKTTHEVISSVVSVEKTLRESFKRTEEYPVIREKILTYKVVISTLINARLMGVLSKKYLPIGDFSDIKALLNLYLHPVSPNDSPWESQTGLEVECDLYFCIHALQRIQEDSDNLLETKETRCTETFVSPATYLESLSQKVTEIDKGDRGMIVAEEISNTDKFAILATISCLVQKIIVSTDPDDKLQSLEYLGFLMYKLNQQPICRESILAFLLTTLVKLLESSRDEDFCVKVIEGISDKKYISVTSVSNDILSTSNHWLRQFHSNSLGSLIYHPLRCVNKLAHRRTVLKKSTSAALLQDEDSTTMVSNQQLQEVNQQFILKKCQKIGMISTSHVTPVEPNDNTCGQWKWSGLLFGSIVCVKVPSTLEEIRVSEEISQTHSHSSSEMFLSELSMLRKLQKHNNILDLYGFCRHQLPMFTITGYFEDNLLDYLTEHTARDNFLSMYNMVHDICIPVVSAIQYCHTKDIVLRDVIAKNYRVKIEASKRVKVKYCEFKLARELTRNSGEYTKNITSNIESDMTSFLGNAHDNIARRWSAPESFQAPYYFSRKSDSWMLACTLYEILTHGCQPYTELYGMSSDEIVLQVIGGCRLKQPACIPTPIFSILLHSLIKTPSKRQSVDTLHDSLLKYSRTMARPDPASRQELHKPPPRDHNQGSEPDRGIPPSISDQKTSRIPPLCSMNNKFPCNLEDITAPDVQCTRGHVTADKTSMIRLEEKLHKGLFAHGRPREEIKVLLQLSHPNIGRVLSFHIQDNITIQMSEYHNVKRNILYIALQKEQQIDRDKLIEYLTQVASGMAYLHSEDIGILHCDLRAAHVYVTQSGQAKIGRLGRACLLELGLYDRGLYDCVKTRQMQPDQIRWSPIEVVCGNIYSQASDIFMFGQLCWEVFNAYDADTSFQPNMLVPYPHSADNEIRSLLAQRKHQLQPPCCPNWLFRLMKNCWLDERERRPSFKVIEKCLTKMNLTPLGTPGHVCASSTVYTKLEKEDEDLYNYYIMGTVKDQEDTDQIYYTRRVVQDKLLANTDNNYGIGSLINESSVPTATQNETESLVVRVTDHEEMEENHSFAHTVAEFVTCALHVGQIYHTNNLVGSLFDASGGYLKIPTQEVSLYIPPGAIEYGDSKRVYLYIKKSYQDEFHSGKCVLTPVISCGPDGTTFLKDVILSCPHSAVNENSWKFSAVTKKSGDPWVTQSEDTFLVNDGRVFIFLEHFTDYQIVGEAKEESNAQRRIKVGMRSEPITDTCIQISIGVWCDTSLDPDHSLQHQSETKPWTQCRSLAISVSDIKMKVHIKHVDEQWKQRGGSLEKFIRLSDLTSDQDTQETFTFKCVRQDDLPDDFYCILCVFLPDSDFEKEVELCVPRIRQPGCTDYSCNVDDMTYAEWFRATNEDWTPQDNQISSDLWRKLCENLDVQRDFQSDWRGLAGKLCLKARHVHILGTKSSPTGRLLGIYFSKMLHMQKPILHALEELVTMFDEMKNHEARDDVKEYIAKTPGVKK
uniref:Uncharacterized protein LOC102806814 n=1 Tax=Saccoglossus kowalevskii TaxID=10224 RepID=A0ABM0MYS0_SACKO|nr:PREDICTED: uncharacterized protein LOC102806814 [Saccoglossus kowalevskii]